MSETFDAKAFIEKLDNRVAKERSTFYQRTIKPEGDKDKFVNIARSLVGGNNEKHEPYLSMFEKVIEAYDSELKRADELEKELERQEWELDYLRHIHSDMDFGPCHDDVVKDLQQGYISKTARDIPRNYRRD